MIEVDQQIFVVRQTCNILIHKRVQAPRIIVCSYLTLL